MIKLVDSKELEENLIQLLAEYTKAQRRSLFFGLILPLFVLWFACGFALGLWQGKIDGAKMMAEKLTHFPLIVQTPEGECIINKAGDDCI